MGRLERLNEVTKSESYRWFSNVYDDILDGLTLRFIVRESISGGHGVLTPGYLELFTRSACHREWCKRWRQRNNST